jgi:hypothetical protein
LYGIIFYLIFVPVNNQKHQAMTNKDTYKALVKSYKRLCFAVEEGSPNVQAITLWHEHYTSLIKNAKYFDRKLLRGADLTSEELELWDKICLSLHIKPNMMQRSKHLVRKPAQERK